MADIRLADHTNTSLITGVISLAFLDLPASHWLVPYEAKIRGGMLAAYFRELVEHAVMLETAYVNEVGTAAAIWVPMPADRDLNLDRVAHEEKLMEAVGGLLFKRFLRFEEAQDVAHPEDLGAHWYLPLIGVHPRAQQKGYGTALLKTVHKLLDEQDLPAYLEAASPRLVEFYRRFHYVPTGQPIVLDGQELLWPMIRYPQEIRRDPTA